MALFSRLAIVALFGSAAAFAGCSALDPVTDAPMVTGPGANALESDDPSCNTDQDCAPGEQCIAGVCQMQRCGTQGYKSVAPLGKRSYFSVDRELVVVDDAPSGSAIEGYEPTSGSFSHPSSLTYQLGGKRVLDVASGDFTGQRPESLAAVAEGSSALHVVTGDQRREIPLGYQPVAAAAGDVDGDSVDEVVVIGRDGDLSVCDIATSTCSRRSVPGISGKDVVVADVDGDGFEEPVVLADAPDGKSVVVAVNIDSETTKQPETVTLATGRTLARIAAFEMDCNAPVEIVALEDGGYGDVFADTLRFIGYREAKLVEIGTQDIAKDAIDVYAGDVNGDDKPELLVLEKSGVEVFVPVSATAVSPSFKTALSSSTKPTRLAMADLDGDSPAGTLTGDPELVPGPVVPVAVLVYPPYSRRFSDGTSQVGVGNRESKAEASETSVGLKVGVGVGFDIDFPGITKVSVIGKVERRLDRGHEKAQSISISDKFSIDAKPDLEGPDNGVAILACACYHAYTYRIEDPAGKLGPESATGKLMSFFVPVGGQTAPWSLKRYNALARRLGNLPVVNVPYLVGDPSSYPKERVKLDGSPLPDSDLLFSSPRAYRTSDVARVGWDLSVGESESEKWRESIGVSLSGILRVGPVMVSADVGASFDNSYRVSVGREASFGGTVPPVRNDVRTPEDEHEMHGYGFSPMVYREKYRTKDGGDGGFYVVTYSVGK